MAAAGMRGILEIPKQLPTNSRDWEQFVRKLNDTIKVSGDKAYMTAVLTMADRLGVTVDQVLDLIGDDGRAVNQSFLPTVNFGNISSVQSSEPLSATAGPTTADIAVAAHTLHTDFGDIAYNAGSITGLTLNTRYYIYADDPDYQGGAVTYIATTSKPNVPANSGRYLVGSITTPVSASTSNIMDATSASPIVFKTTAAHGWATGNIVQFASLPGDFGTNLNGTQREITVIDSDEFSIVVNGTTYAAYTTGGTATRVVPDEFPDYGGGGGGALP
jgi:hypothetical protein